MYPVTHSVQLITLSAPPSKQVFFFFFFVVKELKACTKGMSVFHPVHTVIQGVSAFHPDHIFGFDSLPE